MKFGNMKVVRVISPVLVVGPYDNVSRKVRKGTIGLVHRREDRMWVMFEDLTDSYKYDADVESHVAVLFDNIGTSVDVRTGTDTFSRCFTMRG